MTLCKSTQATLFWTVQPLGPQNRQFHWNRFGTRPRAPEVRPGEVLPAGPIPRVPPQTDRCGARPGIGWLRERGGGFASFIKARSLHHPIPEQI